MGMFFKNNNKYYKIEHLMADSYDIYLTNEPDIYSLFSTKEEAVALFKEQPFGYYTGIELEPTELVYITIKHDFTESEIIKINNNELL